MLAFASLVAGFAVGPQVPRAAPVLRPSASKPMMFVEQVDVPTVLLAKQSMLQSTLNVADSQFSLPSTLNVAEELRKSLKSEADELLDEILLLIPVIVGGGSVAAFGLEYIKNLDAQGGFLPEVRAANPATTPHQLLASRALRACSRLIHLARLSTGTLRQPVRRACGHCGRRRCVCRPDKIGSAWLPDRATRKDQSGRLERLRWRRAQGRDPQILKCASRHRLHSSWFH